MRTKSIFSTIIMTALPILTAVAILFGVPEARAGFPAPPGVPGFLIPPGLPGSNVEVHINGYLPAPPGVNVMIDSGRPYYVERERRVYIERESPPGHYYNRHYKKEKRHREEHDDHGHKYGHYKHDRHDD